VARTTTSQTSRIVHCLTSLLLSSVGVYFTDSFDYPPPPFRLQERLGKKPLNRLLSFYCDPWFPPKILRDCLSPSDSFVEAHREFVPPFCIFPHWTFFPSPLRLSDPPRPPFPLIELFQMGCSRFPGSACLLPTLQFFPAFPNGTLTRSIDYSPPPPCSLLTIPFSKLQNQFFRPFSRGAPVGMRWFGLRAGGGWGHAPLGLHLFFLLKLILRLKLLANSIQICSPPRDRVFFLLAM